MLKIEKGSIPSNKKTAGQPTKRFQLVNVSQKMLSKFQIKKPNTKRKVPVPKT